MCVRARACVCVCGSSTRKTLVCASSEDSRESMRPRESVRPRESDLICADFYNSSKSKYIFTYYMYSKKKNIKNRNTYKMYMKI